MSPVNWALHAARGWDRIEIVRDGARFGVVGVTRCGRRFPAVGGLARVDARTRGRATASELGVPLVDAADHVSATDSGLKTFRWGG